jgi:hypothetical protein
MTEQPTDSAADEESLKWYVTVFADLSKWWVQLFLALIAGLLAVRFAHQLTLQANSGPIIVSVYLPLLSVLAAVFALGSSLLIGHTLQFVNNTAQEKASLYQRFRDVLYRVDDFLRDQDEHKRLVQTARATSWELKKAEREQFPLRDWETRLSALGKAIEEYKKEEPESNLHLEIIGFLTDCEQMHNELAICWIKQVVAPILLRSAIKMLVLLSLLLLALFVMLSLGRSLPLEVQVGVPAFFVMAAILVSVELGLTVSQHVRDMTEESLSGGRTENSKMDLVDT